MVMMNNARAELRRPLAPETGKLPSLAEQMQALGPWQQNLHLPDGLQTAPDHALGDYPRANWNAMATALPVDMRGWRVLDVGCNAGFYSIEFARLGAKVTAMDIDGHCLAQARWAATRLGVTERVEFRRNSVYGLVNERERYDLVWCMGLFDNLRYPLLALDVLRRITRRLLAVESVTARSLVQQAGFSMLASPLPDVCLCEPDPLESEWRRLAREAELQAAVGSELLD